MIGKIISSDGLMEQWNVGIMGRDKDRFVFFLYIPHHSIILLFQREAYLVSLPGALVLDLLGSFWNRPLRDELNVAPDLHDIPDGLFDLFF
jgi:hypothetical protein